MPLPFPLSRRRHMAPRPSVLHGRLSAMEPMDCLVIYVPTEAAHAVRQAIGDAGRAGWATTRTARSASKAPGALRRCRARTDHRRRHASEEVPETRIEAIYPRSRRNAVVDAALSAHPYETLAFMTFPVDASLPDGTGSGD